MAWIPMYLERSDIEGIVTYLDQHDDVAWLVTTGEGSWRAFSARGVGFTPGSTHLLWYAPSGRLPLLDGTESPASQAPRVENPWAGWRESISGADPSIPYFGPAWPGVISVRLEWRLAPDPFPMSSFAWSGGEYGSRALPAYEETRRFWRALNRWVGRRVVKIPREGPVDGPGAEVFAFPAAYSEIVSGREREPNPPLE